MRRIARYSLRSLIAGVLVAAVVIWVTNPNRIRPTRLAAILHTPHGIQLIPGDRVKVSLIRKQPAFTRETIAQGLLVVQPTEPPDLRSVIVSPSGKVVQDIWVEADWRTRRLLHNSAVQGELWVSLMPPEKTDG